MKKNTPKLGTLILDPSPTQRLLIAHLVSKQPQLKLVGAYDNPTEAYRRMGEVKVDLLLLEVDLPMIDGFNFMESLNEDTQTVIITTSAHHALKAFDYGVTDYLLKPINPLRFAQCIQKTLKKYTVLHQTRKKESMTIRCDLQKREVDISELLWVEAMGDYVKLITKTERVVVLSTMKAIVNKLPQDRFLRIHRSYIVNLEKVDNFTSTRVEINGNLLPMSRSRKPSLERRLEPLG
ncbi:LytR/AlgR family response regulator transcription factor [Lentiprolixibacter aurantiacus]|uniref:LytTR family DNA-binding domain-containing protein n=1 Tax=Lentiprolixibacter aurantiacus TaxID=2993939 RepID=A0AAE3MMG7_9FLAO|nr:LytTR family DNA-binding domain-containing protein [Lentiprolixibacter aurantiacus]MCX2720118.1 LytTR family DNA-binding domain-containing protein [Lentiprolixibacter aurantiacus]